MADLEAIWAKLTDYNPACSCCNGDNEYISLVNEIGAMIDSRRWVRRYKRTETGGAKTVYETVREQADA
jgi:hypothetical protein